MGLEGSHHCPARGGCQGSLFQYFADKRDLYAFIADVGGQRVRAFMEGRILELDASRPFFEFLTDLLDSWVTYFADHPRERSLHAAASLEVDTDARISVRTSFTATTWRSCGHSYAPRTSVATCRGRRYRRVVIATTADLPAPGAGTLRARNRSDPRA